MMSVKKENNTRSNRATGMKLLNDVENSKSLSLPMVTSVPLSPNKQVNILLSKKKLSPNKNKQMDHYVLQTIKGESNTDGDMGETIDFILRDDGDDDDAPEMAMPRGEITSVRLSDEEDDDEADGEAKAEEIVEHVCGKCFKTFRRFNGLKKHLDFCRFDSGYHLRKAEMLKNLEKIEKDAVIMEKKDVCFCCGESYDTFHLGHINCPDCPKSFKSQVSYERHIFITHSENNDFPCSICNAKLRSEALLKLHEEQHQNRGKPFACKICGRDFTRSYHLKRHQKYSSCSARESDSMNCKVCNKVFYRLDNLRAHLKQHLGTQVTKKPEYMCPTCKNCFYSLSTLNIHTRTHTGERPFNCDLCEKNFPSLVALKKHRRYHTGEKPYTCSVCGTSFAVKEVLNRHMKRHTGERPHSCNECGKSFIQATQLRNHAKTHIRPFECKECQEKFKTAKQLDRHSKEHNVRRHRKIRCKRCRETFRTIAELEKHNALGSCESAAKRTRKKERTDCAVCEEKFDTPKSLAFHILKVHEADPEDFVNEKPDAEKEAEASPPKRIKLEKDSPEKKVSPKRKRESKDLTMEIEQEKVEEVVEEFLVDEVLERPINGFTIIHLESENNNEAISTTTTPPEAKAKTRGTKKGLAESLAAAIADNEEALIHDDDLEFLPAETEEDMKLKDNVRKLLDMLVDSQTLKKFRWPDASEEEVLCKVIENCGHDLSMDSENYSSLDYATRMRVYVKLLFTVVIHNDSIKELLNNYSIDEVIEYVLGNEDDDDADPDEEEEKNNSILLDAIATNSA